MPDSAKEYPEVVVRFYHAMEAALLHRDVAMMLRKNRGEDDLQTEAAAEEAFQAFEQVREIALKLTEMSGQLRLASRFGRLGLN